MIRPYRLLVSLSLLSLVLAASSWGQTDTQGGPSGLYNPDTVVTVSGIVLAKTQPAAKAPNWCI